MKVSKWIFNLNVLLHKIYFQYHYLSNYLKNTKPTDVKINFQVAARALVEDLDGDVGGNPPLEAASNSNGPGAEDFSSQRWQKDLIACSF